VSRNNYQPINPKTALRAIPIYTLPQISFSRSPRKVPDGVPQIYPEEEAATDHIFLFYYSDQYVSLSQSKKGDTESLDIS
jgi:hypothetical protein